jgi:predicted flap endonuclease-1-like 5' DNA nuclease
VSSPPGFVRPSTHPVGVSATAQLEQRLGATQIELRKLGSERHTLRSRLRRESDRLHELESALRAEKELRRQASDEHLAALLGVRTRLAEVEAERDKDLARLTAELSEARQALAAAEAQLAASHAASEAPQAAASSSAPARAVKVVQGLRRIRGIGPGYQRVLEQLGVTRVQQIAVWTSADITSAAEKLRIKPERIQKDDWVGQARALDPDPED